MGANTAPSDEEVERFVELYEEIGTIKGVAEHEDVDWSRPTVSKWLKRKGALGDGEEGSDDDGEPDEPNVQEPELDTSEVDERYSAKPGDSGDPANLMEEPPAPNDILLDILDRDPKIGEDEIAYISSFFDEYGQLSTSDVTDILSDININNKRMTISRVNRHYTKAINQRLREDPNLQYDMRWATLLTKTTGDQMYVQQAQQYENDQMGVGAIRPPAGGDSGPGSVEAAVQPPTPNGQNSNRQGIQPPAPEPTPQQQRPTGQPHHAPNAQQGGSGQQLDPFQQRLLEMLEQQLEDDSDSQPQQSAQQQPSDPTSQIQQLIELQQQLEELQPGDGQDDEVNEMIQQVSQQFNSRLAQLEEQLAEQGQGRAAAPDPSPDTGSASPMTEIVAIADKVDDPELLKTLIEMEMDPDVLEAKAKQTEAQNESEWKKSLAESLSPAAAEKAVDAFMNLTSGISQQTNQRVNGPPQQVQQQQPREVPQQPQEPRGGRAAQGVEVVEDEEPQAGARRPTSNTTDESNDPPEASPLREEGEAEIQGEDGEEDVSAEDTEEEP